MDVYALAPVSEDRSRFGSSCWAWRPIHLISELSISVFRLPLSTKGWEENSGFGLSNQADCDMLADAIDGFLVLNKNNAFEDSDRIYVLRILDRPVQRIHTDKRKAWSQQGVSRRNGPVLRGCVG